MLTEGCLAILGPTCSWKSTSSMHLAEALDGEIISADSMQVYRGMNIGTATPSEADLAAVPHHLVNCLSIQTPYDAHAFTERAECCIRDIRGRGAIPIITGGTGLYARALIYALPMFPADRELGRRLEDEFALPGGKERLLDEVRRGPGGDAVPTDVERNPRRLLRTVEILRLTGDSPWNRGKKPILRPDITQYVVLPDMAILRPRIEARVQKMLSDGWLEETRRLLTEGLFETPTARQALGYADVAEYLAGRIATEKQLAEIVTRKTIRLARRQRTWFRNQHREAIQVRVHRETGPREIAKCILASLEYKAPHPAVLIVD